MTTVKIKRGDDPNQKPITVQNITVRPISRQKTDITNWRNATKAAESLVPRRVTLYDLYEDITSTDAQVISVWSKRVDAVTSAEWIFTDKNGKPVDEINQMIDCIGFGKLVTEILNSKSWGYTMLEPTFFLNANDMFEIKPNLVPRKHMRPNTGIIANEQTGDSGLNIREGIYAKTVMEIGEPTDLGLLLSAAMYAIYKRGDIGDWAEFIEIFGRGIIDATWDGFDENQRVQLSDALHAMGGGGIIIRPDGTKIDIKQNTGNANGALQESFARICDEWIAKVLLGSTETSGASKSSGYAQGKVHQDEDVKKNESDIHFVRRCLNSQFIKCLIAAGFPAHGGTFVIKSIKKINKEKFEIHKSMALDLKIPVDDDFFYEEYGMPKPKNYEALKAEIKERESLQIAHTPTTREDKVEETEEKSAKSGGSKDVKMSDRSWIRKALTTLTTLSFFVAAPTASGATRMTNCCGSHHTTLSLPKSSLNVDASIQRYWDAGGKLTFDIGSFNNTAQILLSGLISGWNKREISLVDLGFEYGVDDPALLTSYEMNLFRFSAAKTLAEAQKLNELFRNAPDFETFLINARISMEVFNTQWLQAEYNSAMLTGESAATYARLMKQTDLFPFWRYRTVGDNKVRPEHALLDDLILPCNDPRWKKLFPPNGWGCRCYIVGVMKHEADKIDLKAMRARADNYIQSPEFKKLSATGWGVNRAMSGEVFAANQFYVKKFEGKASKMLDKLKPSDYGLQSYSQAKKVAETDLPVYNGTAEDFLAANAEIKDYKNRSINIDPANFERHTTGNRAYRTEYLNALKEALIKPDEVWVNGAKYDEFLTVKYYNDQTLITISSIREGRIYEVKTWFPLTEKAAVIDKYRKGLLIYSKK